jgi:hypothetical protein
MSFNGKAPKPLNPLAELKLSSIAIVSMGSGMAFDVLALSSLTMKIKLVQYRSIPQRAWRRNIVSSFSGLGRLIYLPSSCKECPCLQLGSTTSIASLQLAKYSIPRCHKEQLDRLDTVPITSCMLRF